MAALTADRKTNYREGVEIEYPVAANAIIYAGSLVMANASGYAVPGADTSSCKFLGVALEHVNATGKSNGELKVTVRRKGVFYFATSGIAITNVGDGVCLVDDQTVNLASVTTNDVACGKIAEFVSATEVGVDIDMR